jgi:hypothetical protein
MATIKLHTEIKKLNKDLAELGAQLTFNEKMEVACKCNISLSTVLNYMNHKVVKPRLAAIILKQAQETAKLIA